MRGDVRRWIESAGLGRVSDEILALRRPSIRVRTWDRDEGSIEVGASKVGGLPDLPPDFDWPYWGGWPEHRAMNAADHEPMPGDYLDRPGHKDGPMCFLAQFRLADVAPQDSEALLPPTGMLWFFCALWVDALGCSEKDRGAWQVTYRDVPASPLRRTPPPADSSKPLGCRAVAFFEEWTIPANSTLEYDRLGLDDDEHMRYCRLLMDQMQSHPWQDLPTHRLLGWPQCVQADMQGTIPEAGPGKDWRLLLQLDSDHQQHLQWQSGGRGTFLIREADLKARNFDNTWVVMQVT